MKKVKNRWRTVKAVAHGPMLLSADNVVSYFDSQ